MGKLWPDISPLVWKVLQRHLAVYRKTWKVSMSLNFIEPLLYLSALGLGLGAYVQPIEGMPYLGYLAPGLIASSAMFATSYECTYGTFIRMDFQKTFHAIIATPASIDDVIMGEVLFGTFKSLLYGSTILLVVFGLKLVSSPWVLLIPVVLALSGLFFAVLAMTWTGLVPNINSFNYFFSLIITPLFLFSGVFFPLTGMPALMQQVAWFSPLYHVVKLTRGLAAGDAVWLLAGDFIWLLAATVILLPAPLFLLRRLTIK
jgi:lipooligosaccharide transport system permease protein